MSEETTGNPDAGELLFPTPYLSSASPDSGKANDTITLHGEHMASVTKVTYTASSTSNDDDNPSSLTASSLKSKVPSGLTGNGSVTVTNNGGTSNSIDFTFLAT